MTEKNKFIYKLFLSLNISDFSLFLKGEGGDFVLGVLIVVYTPRVYLMGVDVNI